jgi:trigger factor
MAETDSMKLSVKVKKGQAWTRYLEVEVPAEAVTSKIEIVFEDFRRKARVPGFRPGKVPMGIVRQRFADDVRVETLEQLLPEAYQKAIIQENMIPLGSPKISEVEFEKDRPLKFKAEIEIQPEIKINKYKGFRLEKRIRKATDKDVEDAVQYLREKKAEFHPVERASAKSDMVIVDLLKKHDKLGTLKEDKLEDVEVYLGSQGVLKEFDRELTGVSIGEMKNIQVDYPGDYYDPNLAGNRILFTAVVKDIKRKELPELTDDFVSSVSRVKTVDELKGKIKADLEARAQDEATRRLRSEIIKRVVEGNSFDVPISMLDRYLDSVVEDFKDKGEKVDEEIVRRQYRQPGENFIRWSYLYHEIAGIEGIKVAKEDKEKWVEDFAATYNITKERAKEYLGKSRKAQEIDESILEDKILEFIIRNSEVITTEE